MKSVEVIEVEEAEGEARIDRWFRRRFPHVTQGQVEKLLRTGQIRVDGARAKAADRIRPGQQVRVPPLPDAASKPAPGTVLDRDAQYAQSLVIHKDEDVLILNKPPGLAVQGGSKTTRHLDAMLPALKFGYEIKPKLVHRLDRDTSGCLVLARTIRAAAFLSNAFRAREVTKIYWAVVLGTPRPLAGQLRGWMRKAPGAHEADREMVQRCLQQDEGAVHAITDYAVISDAGGRASWVALSPQTGRTHQLRFHMAEIGCAILGDPKYRCDRPTPGGLSEKLHLHARAIDLPHPNGKRIKAQAAIPEHFKRTFEALGFEEREAKNPYAAFE